MTETRVEVSLKPKELALYHSHQSNSLAHLLQFCSYHNELQGTNEEETTYTVSETAELLQKERRQRQEQIQSEIATIDANIEQLWQMLKLEISERMPRLLPQMIEFENTRVKFVNLALAEISTAEPRLRALVNKLNAAFSGLKGCNTSLASVLRQQAYYDSILQLLSNSQPIDCAIHMGPIPMETTALLICGHYFCQACLTACWANLVNLTCPCCRYPIKPNRDMRIVDRRPEEEVQKEKEANLMQEADLSNRYGSKIRSLLSIIGRIQADPDQGKILVFAQWDNLLKQIGDALKSLGIPNACPRGNIGQINSAFNQFYTDRQMRVLLLSTKHNLSGSHLVEANNLIFVHPFPDAPDAALREWEQAVSRMQRFGQKRDLHVYYMVTKNTVEVELFKTFVEFKDKQQAILAKIESIVTEDVAGEPTEVL